MNGTQGLDARIAQQHERLGELDRSIISLIERRSRVAQDLDGLCRGAHVPGVDLSKENEMLRRYHAVLGRPGTSIALLMLELGRPDVRLTPAPTQAE
ncbi:chorismate mutase family protein [Kitasatospora mediocidica]|uniref:hypothetical protein n=1 Tax=Kitasatospora mediocidica TaxID=58352 RepID=UPI00068B7A0E|nr:hypothetical protein [Kitasatospora mediocidica]